MTKERVETSQKYTTTLLLLMDGGDWRERMREILLNEREREILRGKSC